MKPKEKALRVWFTGGTQLHPIRADGCVVGAAGELKLYVDDVITVIIAPGAWTFVEVPTP